MDHVYLSGPPLVGLYGMFDADYGDPDSPRPYPRVTPSRAGALMLPFRCPRCPATVDFSDPARREDYHDTRPLPGGARRDNYFCPRCGVRFTLNDRGQPMKGKLATDGAAPSVVETIAVGADGKLSLRRTESIPGGALEQYLLGCDLLSSS